MVVRNFGEEQNGSTFFEGGTEAARLLTKMSFDQGDT